MHNLIHTRNARRANFSSTSHFKLEARVGIGRLTFSFAEPCLTTWLPRHLTPIATPMSSDAKSLPAVSRSDQAEPTRWQIIVY